MRLCTIWVLDSNLTKIINTDKQKSLKKQFFFLLLCFELIHKYCQRKNMQIEIENAVQALNQGKIILYPTDTVWGLGCDATDEEAVEKIFTIKKRSATKSLIVMVSNFLMLRQYVREVPFKAVELMEEATGPLTVIYPESKKLAHNLLAEDGSVGIRIPNDEFCKGLISAFGKPIVSTSANISGEKPTSVFRELSTEIVNNVDYVVSYRQEDETICAPSHIVKVDNSGNVITIR